MEITWLLSLLLEAIRFKHQINQQFLRQEFHFDHNYLSALSLVANSSVFQKPLEFTECNKYLSHSNVNEFMFASRATLCEIFQIPNVYANGKQFHTFGMNVGEENFWNLVSTFFQFGIINLCRLHSNSSRSINTAMQLIKFNYYFSPLLRTVTAIKVNELKGANSFLRNELKKLARLADYFV